MDLVTNGGAAISPDGKTLAFVAKNVKGDSLLYVRPLDSLEARALPGTENADRPFWSPDSKSLGFGANRKLKRIDLAGGGPIELGVSGLFRGATWNQHGVILFAVQGTGLQKISASGGTAEAVTSIDSTKGERRHSYPQFLPGGKEFIYLVLGSDTAAGVYWGSLDAQPPVRILATAFNALYDANSGRLLYVQGAGALMARKLELNPPRLSGEAVLVAQAVRGSQNNGYAEFSLSANGTLLHGRGGLGSRYRFAWWDRKGSPIESVGQFVQMMSTFSLSPDGSRVTYVGAPLDIWVMPIASGIATRVTFSGGSWPCWSPDGKQIYYADATGIFRKAADGSGGEELVAKEQSQPVLNSVSPDGKNLLFGRGGIMRLPLEGEKKPVPYLQTKFQEGRGVFSPDGRWVAYQSDESGRMEIYIQGFPESRGKWQVSAEGGSAPHWRADGKELYWLGSRITDVVAASIELQAAAVKSGRPELLFRVPSPQFATLDGKRFLVQVPEGEQQVSPMAVITNWAAGLGK